MEANHIFEDLNHPQDPQFGLWTLGDSVLNVESERSACLFNITLDSGHQETEPDPDRNCPLVQSAKNNKPEQTQNP